MNKIFCILVVLYSVSTYASEFKLICASDESTMINTGKITKNVVDSINQQLKEFGDRIVEVSTPNGNLLQSNGVTSQLTCLTIELK